MTRVLLAGLLTIAVLAGTTKQVAAHSPEEAQALAERAADYIREHGRQQAFAAFNRPDGGFVDGDMYVFCNDAAGIQLVNGGNPRMVGKNMSAVPDAKGTLTAPEIFRIGQTQGHGWYEYYWPNLISGRVERKAAYIVRIDDQTVCATGYYKRDQP